MADEDKEIELDGDEIEQIISWAIGTGALITLLHSSDEPENDEECRDFVDRDIEAIEMMYHNMPDCLVEHAHEIAGEIVDTEEEIDTFREQLDNFKGFSNDN